MEAVYSYKRWLSTYNFTRRYYSEEQRRNESVSVRIVSTRVTRIKIFVLLHLSSA
jgi:hypothetical protein